VVNRRMNDLLGNYTQLISFSYHGYISFNQVITNIYPYGPEHARNEIGLYYPNIRGRLAIPPIHRGCHSGTGFPGTTGSRKTFSNSRNCGSGGSSRSISGQSPAEAHAVGTGSSLPRVGERSGIGSPSRSHSTFFRSNCGARQRGIRQMCAGLQSLLGATPLLPPP